MNKLLKVGTAALLAATMVGCSSAPADDSTSKDSEVITIGVSPDYAPYESLTTDNELVGFDIDMAAWFEDYLTEEEGVTYSLEFKQMSFDNIITQIQGDQIDIGISGFTYDEEREVEWSDPYIKTAQVAVVPNGSSIASVDDLVGKKLAAQTGATGEIAANEVEGAEVSSVQNVQDIFTGLAANQYDAAIVDLGVAKQYVSSGNFTMIDGSLLDEENYVIAKKGNTVSAYYKWADQTEWTKICDQTYTGFTSELKLGLYVANAGEADAYIPATFRDFTVQYGDGEAKAIPFAVKNEADKSDLQALITYAQDAKKDANYEYVVPAVKDLFEKALDAAVKVEENVNATQEEVNDAYEALLEKVHLLDFTGNTENLQVLVDLADAKVESMYTAESWAPFAEALKTAKEVLADENALQEEIDAAREALQEAMDGLVKKETVNKDKLAALVKDAEQYEAKLDEYIPSTTEGFVAALKGAQDVLANDEATKEEVDSAYHTLLQAIFNLRMKPSKDKLEELLNKVEKMDLTQYSEKRAKALKAAYESAVLVMKDENAEQEEVDAAVKSLQKAIAVAKAETGNGSGAKDESDNKAPTKAPAKTGDAANAAIPMMAGIAAVLAVLFGKKRK